MTLSEIRRRPNLPGRFQPSTFSVLRLNFCVRDGNRWIPQAIVTGKEQGSRLSLPRFLLPSVAPCLALLTSFQRFPPRFRSASSSRLRTLKTAQVGVFPPPDHGFGPLSSTFYSHSLQDQALDLLVSPSSIHCCTSTDDLSTLSSSRGLTCFIQWQFYSLGGLHA